MQIINNAFVTIDGAYYESGGFINGTQRNSGNHLMFYWQQPNQEIKLAKDLEEFKNHKIIKEALYVGRIPTHFGHFLIEGLPRLCDAVDNKFPLIGFISYGKSPSGPDSTKIDSIEWIIKTITSKKFYRVKEKQVYKINRLYIPKLPLILSQSCPEPWRMTPMIEKIVKAARLKHPEITDEIDCLYLKRNKEKIIRIRKNNLISNPESHVSEQIAKVSYAKKLRGKTGSNSHLSMFARYNTYIEWESRGDFEQGDRNQYMCDIIKTFNTYK